jgi:diacylglycerol kinase (ATP)
MRAAAILGLGCSAKNLKPFQTDPAIEWSLELPSSNDEADVVLVFGGDGTVHRHLSSLVAPGLPVLVVPVGSGNDFARGLGFRSVHDSLTAWHKFCREKNNIRAIDLGIIRPLEIAHEARALSQSAPNSALAARYFCSVAGVGLDAEATRRANGLPRWLRRHGGYALSLAPALFRFAPLPMKIATPVENRAAAFDATNWDIRSDQPTMLAAFANTPTYGGGMKIAPKAKLDDGLLDVCVIAGIDPFKLACLFPTVYFGRHLSVREVSYFQTPKARVETKSPLDVYADGEYVCRTPVEITVERRALRVLTR